MQRWYYQDGYFGRVVQQILLPPMTAFSYDKSTGRSIRKSHYLPPRLSLRPLASHKFLGYMIVGAVVTNLFGYDAAFFVFVVFLLWFLFVCLKAVGKSNVNRRENTETRRQGYSLRDSF